MYGLNKIDYWLKNEPVQNLGDFLSEYLARELLGAPRILADKYRLIGSVIDAHSIKYSLGRQRNTCLAFWGCGKRDEKEISQKLLSRCSFHGVRGPLTQKCLGLPENTPYGDPALLLPIFHPVTPCRETAGKTVAVPHMFAKTAPEELLALSGADCLISPKIPADQAVLKKTINQIASAKFVLAGAMHAAVIACAYGVPFAYWDSGYIDIPFKWHDFAASLSIPCLFASNVAQGVDIYKSQIAGALKKPPLLQMLLACPFYIKPSAYIKYIKYEKNLADNIPVDELMSELYILEESANTYAQETASSIRSYFDMKRKKYFFI